MDEPSVTLPTRREILKSGGAVVGGGLLAGCTAESSPPSGRANSSNSSAGGNTTAGDGGNSYSVVMAPVGTVRFEDVPSNVMIYSLPYADMAVAYGHGNAVNSLGFDVEAGVTSLNAYYARLDGVSFDREGVVQLNSGSEVLTIDKELFYKLDSDLHMVDPCLVLSFKGWDQADIEEIRTNISPWFGNSYSRKHRQPPKECRDHYRYYTLWKLAEKVAAVFQEQQRFKKLAAVHDDLLEQLRSHLPPKNDRPTVGSVIFMNETFYPSKINTPGYGNAHIRPLEATDAFATGDVTYETSFSYETMLEIDPDIILHQYGIASYYNVDQISETLANHPVGSQLTAVQNGRVYPGANPEQGPIMNLFQLEMTAKQLYPEQFGKWPEYDSGPYPKIPEDEQLFDRKRVADIINGNF